MSPNSSWWTDFEDPDWGEWAIVKDDWKCHPEEHLKVCPDNCTCGAADTGENACYAADIDHTNPAIQADIIKWLRWLRTDVGFDAFRFDNTKGYSGEFTSMYIHATDPVYSVSEFYDSNRALISGWLDSSGRYRCCDVTCRASYSNHNCALTLITPRSNLKPYTTLKPKTLHPYTRYTTPLCLI